MGTENVTSGRVLEVELPDANVESGVFDTEIGMEPHFEKFSDKWYTHCSAGLFATVQLIINLHAIGLAIGAFLNVEGHEINFQLTDRL